MSYARGRHSDSAAQNLVDGGTGKVSSYGALTANAFVAHDGNGNVIALIQENGGSGTILANYEYGPFGEVIRATGPMAKLNPFRFSTKYDDDETDFLYYGYRFYNPSTGRWLNRDPIEELGGINLYNFCGNAPSGKTDDFGLSGELVGCPACVCKKVKYGKVPTTFSAYHDNQGNGNIGLTVPYTIETEGINSHCHCKYVDNGSISGSAKFANGQQFSPNTTWNNTTTNIPCASGSDTPGFQFTFPPGFGFSVTFTINYNWTGTVSCESPFGPTLTDSTGINGSYSSSATWRPTK